METQVKFYAKPDPHYLNELENEEAPVDDFKEGRVPMNKVPAVKFVPTAKPNAQPPSDPQQSIKNLQKNMEKARAKPRAFMARFSSSQAFYRDGPKVAAYDPCASDIPPYSSFEVLNRKRADDTRPKNHGSHLRNSFCLISEPMIEHGGNIATTYGGANASTSKASEKHRSHSHLQDGSTATRSTAAERAEKSTMLDQWNISKTGGSTRPVPSMFTQMKQKMKEHSIKSTINNQ